LHQIKKNDSILDKKDDHRNKLESGNILIAQAFTDDAYFGRTVLMIAEHNKDGSVGFVINKAIEPKMNELIVDFPTFEGIVYYGGPVATDTIHYLHNVPLLLEDSIHVKEDLYWGGDFNRVKILVKEGLLTPDNIRFYVGYSGWTKGQLEDELKARSWVVSDISTKEIFKEQNDELWQEVLHNMGENYAVISQVSNKNKWN